MEWESSHPQQGFSNVGLDAEVARLIAHDIQQPAPGGYENAGIWAELIVEAAMQHAPTPELPKVDSDQFNSYTWNALVEPQPEDSPDRKRLAKFTNLLGGIAVTKQAYIDLPGGGFTSCSTWQYRPDSIGSYMRRKLEYDDLGEEASNLIHQVRQQNSTMPTEQLVGAAERLQAIAKRVKALNPAQYDDRWAWREYDGPRLDSGLVRLGERNLETSAEMVTAKARFMETLDRVIAETEQEPNMKEHTGAKGANLLRLKAVIDGLKQAGVGVADYLHVPAFMVLTTDYYESYKRGELIVDGVRNIKEWMQKTDPSARYVVRSSAVNSEDGEHMGAGVYESVLLPPELTSTQIFQALKLVYASVDSPEALAYRESIGVTDEKMAVIVQQVPDAGLYGTATLTLNTLMPHVPQLAHYELESGVHPLMRTGKPDEYQRRFLPLDRVGMAFELGSDVEATQRTAPRFHVPPDTNLHYLHDSWLASQAGMLAEKVFGRPVQIEAIIPDEPGDQLYLVQARPLPSEWLIPHEFVGFPDEEEPWYEGAAVGVYNGVEVTVKSGISMLSLYLKGTEGIVMPKWDNSFATGRLGIEIERSLLGMSEADRKRIVCLIEQNPELNDDTGYGHLETMFAELGIGLVFADKEGGRRHRFVNGQKAVLYANGYKAKLYSSEDDPVYREDLEGFDRQDEEQYFDDDEEELSESTWSR